MDQNLKLGERLDLLVGNIYCPARLEEITPEGTLIVTEPEFRSPILRGDKLTMQYYRRGGLYSCTVLVTRKLLDRERMLALLEIEIRSQITKYQRREYVRFELSIDVAVVLLAPPESAHQTDVKRMAREIEEKINELRAQGRQSRGCIITDISGGGLRIASRQRFPVGAVIGCEFVLGESDLVRACCLVMNEDQRDAELPYSIGCRFAFIDERVHRRIIRYIFAEQIRRAKRM